MSGTVGTNSSRGSGSIGDAAAGPTVSANDPVITTNAVLGTQWANSTSGEFYICTTDTTNENVWTNVGAGSGDIRPRGYGGLVSGYVMGKYPATNQIQKFSFTSDGNTVDAGNLSVTKTHATGGQSLTHGYSAAGVGTVVIDKFEFSSDGDSSDVGDCTQVAEGPAGCTANNEYSYCAGGNPQTPEKGIEKYSLPSDGNAANIGNLTVKRMAVAGCSSGDFGYCTAGHGPPRMNIIDKFSFSSDGAAVDVGDIDMGIDTGLCGASATNYGYVAGGVGNLDNIEKFSFASGTQNGAAVGNLSAGHSNTGAYSAGLSSDTYGYCAGGGTPQVNTVDKWSFSSDGNASDVGDCLSVIYYIAGTHY